ncbi:hypothetical protein BXZ70DRAFT_894673, partial [Cristinia sonorae]
DFCLIPMGTGEPSVAEYIAECARILQKSGLKHQVPPRSSPPHAHTTCQWIEGPWTEVSKAIHDCHAAVHAKGAPRVATDIRIGTRVDRDIAPGTGNYSKLQRVQDILAKDKKD